MILYIYKTHSFGPAVISKAPYPLATVLDGAGREMDNPEAI